QQSRERGRATVGRDRDRDAASANDAACISRRMCPVVHRVHEDVARLRCLEHLAVHVGRSRGDDVPGNVEIALVERATLEHDAGHLQLGPDLRRHHRDTCALAQQAMQLSGGNASAADEQHLATGELQECGIHHALTVCGATTRSKSDSLRPIVTGGSTRSRMTSAVLYPLPVMQTTTDSFGLITPRWISVLVTASVVPPAGSVKMPSVQASR